PPKLTCLLRYTLSPRSEASPAGATCLPELEEIRPGRESNLKMRHRITDFILTLSRDSSRFLSVWSIHDKRGGTRHIAGGGRTMATGWLPWRCLRLAAPAGGSDEVYMSQRAFTIPIRIEKARQAEVRELILYLSKNQGQNWETYSLAKPDKKGFEFFAAGDGTFWFSVAVVNQKGIQEPPDIYKAPVGQKIVVDTTKPHVRILSADRIGEEIQVRWEVRDEHPEWESLRLEYRPTDSPSAHWTPLPVQKGDGGNRTFRPGVSGDV